MLKNLTGKKLAVAPTPTNEDRDDPEEEILPPLFTKQYVILKNIFEKLAAVDLLRSAQVCKIWSEAARNVRKHRKNKCFSILYHPYFPHTTEAVEYFNFMQNFPEHCGILSLSVEVRNFMGSCTNEEMSGFPNPDNLINDVELDYFVPNLKNVVKKAIHAEKSEIQMVICFGTMCLNVYITDQDDLDNIVGGAVPIVGSIGYGVTATIPGDFNSVEVESDSLPMISCLAVPKIPGFRIKECTIDKLKIVSAINVINKLPSCVTSNVTAENCEDILQITPEDNVKGIILISHTYNRDFYKSSILKAICFYLQKHPNVAVGGGEQHKIISTETSRNPVLAKILLICGDENVSVASVALRDRKITSRNEENLLKIKNAKLEENGSFAFMFACNGRGYNMHRDSHVECTLFRKHFPKTCLVGSFTGGEFFHEYVPGNESTPPNPKKPNKLEYSFTTVFVFVSCKQPAIAKTSN